LAFGVNPFAHNKVVHLMWLIMLTKLNLPQNLFSSILLGGIIPSNGSKEPQEPQSLAPYLDILVNEMLEISCCTLYDTYQNAPFKCKVAVLLYVLVLEKSCQLRDLMDFRAVCSVKLKAQEMRI